MCNEARSLASEQGFRASISSLLQTPEVGFEGSQDMSGAHAAQEALEVVAILAELGKIEGLLAKSKLGTSQLDGMMQQLGSEYILDPACRTQRRLGDIDYEMLSR